jgi:hypothetical protein
MDQGMSSADAEVMEPEIKIMIKKKPKIVKF